MVYKRKLHCQRVWWHQCRPIYCISPTDTILPTKTIHGSNGKSPKMQYICCLLHPHKMGQWVPFNDPSWVRHGIENTHLVIYPNTLLRNVAVPHTFQTTPDSGTRCPAYKHGEVSSLAERPKSIATSRWESGWRHWQRRWAPRRWEQPWNSIPDSEKKWEVHPRVKRTAIGTWKYSLEKERHLQTTIFWVLSQFSEV